MLLCLPFYFFDVGSPGLSDGEAMYPEIDRQMLITHDWITPHLYGTPLQTTVNLLVQVPMLLGTIAIYILFFRTSFVESKT